MIHDPTARDYSYVKGPGILSFLISHELFRQELAEQMPPAEQPKMKVSMMSPVQKVLRLLGKRGAQRTCDISRATGQQRTATLTMLHRMVEQGNIIRIGRTKDEGGTYTRAIWWELRK